MRKYKRLTEEEEKDFIELKKTFDIKKSKFYEIVKGTSYEIKDEEEEEK